MLGRSELNERDADYALYEIASAIRYAKDNYEFDKSHEEDIDHLIIELRSMKSE